MNQVPSDGPVIETLRVVDGQSIFLKWRALPQKYANGIVRGYTIWYWSRYSSWQNLSLSADQLQVTVTGLQSCVWYAFGISAFTSKGEGPRYYEYITTSMYVDTEACCHLTVKIKIPLHVTQKKLHTCLHF